MIKRLLIIILIAAGVISPVMAQQTGWCGYALIEGLPLLANQLAPFEAITPDESKTVNPSSLFQYRFSLDHSKVIIEGCWKADLTRDLVVTLLSQTIDFDSKVMADQVAEAIDAAVKLDQSTVDPAQVTRDYIDEKLTFSIFAPGQTREVAAAVVRDYIAGDSKEWTPPDEQ